MTALPWYHKTTIYQIYPRSFYDSNGDGIGDIPGIHQKLDHIQELGFETLWISPFFASPQADFGYDISNYTEIAPEYGTLEDVAQLIKEVHRRGMKILFDMVMNHTSIEHPWFQESISSRKNSKADWYIWHDPLFSPLRRGAGGHVPNNWQTIMGGSGWHYARERGQYFWASFLPFQPDLNYHNPKVKRAMLDIVRFWLGKGVDGFRLDMFNSIYKDAEFRDNPFSFTLVPTDENSSGFFQDSKYTVNQPENFEFAKEFRSVCDEFGEILSIGEVFGGTRIIRRFLGDETNDGLTLVFDFRMLAFRFSADYFRDLIHHMERHYPHPFMPVYVFSNHDRRRSIEWLGGDMRKAKLLHLFQLTVRGVPCMYYGEEIGMPSSRFSFATALDPIAHQFEFLPRFVCDALGITINRDDVRTPMQWDATKNAGFSSADKTWLPVHENYARVNVAAETKDQESLFSTIRAALTIRGREKALQEGSLQLMENLPENVLGYTRRLNGENITILLNFDEKEKEFEAGESNSLIELSIGSELRGRRIKMGTYGGLILKDAT